MGKRADKSSENGDHRRVTSELLSSWEGIGYLTECVRVDGRERKWASGTLGDWTKSSNRSCKFKAVFCESVVFQRWSRLIE
ncbi:hypothetical protein EVAR_4288_1 [Eumeta japonica]|uniref:Uncharacterized protein n=1 Tax=Eumeta variegata TaxID=151549 RepID=A0A4C1VDW7_EUMVA|nr:hypothetical protein EVAR_4288_1 [Eumeta japonica]